jgi:GntR family transcriptional regulator / MocR family aminotransferase
MATLWRSHMTAKGLRSTATLFVEFDRASDAPYYQQIYRGVRAAIVEGRVSAGQRLPSTRTLADELGVSRLPVLNAYDQLLHEGYLVGRAGAGTYVAASIALRPRRTADGPAGPSSKGRADRVAPGGRAPSRKLAPLRVGLPALDQFPRKTWARLVSRHARQLSFELMAYGGPAGYPPLRAAISAYLRAARGMRCEPGQVLIVGGSQMALRLCASVLLTPRDVACVEDPGYPGAWAALRATGAGLCGVRVDDHGLVVDDLDDRSRARVVYVTPSHQYPLGMPMSASRRLELLQWARRSRAWIIEDDYDSEYRFASRPLGALQGMDDEERVIYVGTFSKVLFPALRIGYVVVPPSLLDRFLAHRDALDLFSPTLYQAALTDFIVGGHFARHLRNMRATYRKRRDALVTAIERLPDRPLRIVNADAGMHLCAWLPPTMDDVEVVHRALQHGLCPAALSPFYIDKVRRRTGLVLGFGGSNEAQIARAIHALSSTMRALAGRRRAKAAV